MTDPPEAFDDVNEAVGAEWETETTPSERVREVVSRAYTPVSADTVAESARTAPKTARKHLDALAEEGFVTTEPGEHGGTVYRRSPESLVVEQAADILESVSIDELTTRVAEMRDRIGDYQAEYGVESPEELVVDRANGTLGETAGADDTADRTTGADDTAGRVTEVRDDVDPETIRDWQTTRRNLAFANAALSIAHAERFVGDDSDTAGGNALAQ